MKKVLVYVLVTVILFCINPSVAYADDVAYGRVNLSVTLPAEVIADVSVTLLNTSTNEEMTIVLMASSDNKVSFRTKFGTYTMVRSYVGTTNGYELSYSVVLDDFTLDETNPNGNWEWNVVGKVIDNAILDYHVTTTPTPTGSPQSTIHTFYIDENNVYFPEMTIPQIQEWYTNEAIDFIESGKTELTLDVLQADVTKWADWVTRKNNSILNAKYRVDVDNYNTDETKDFYEAQKKIYDFLWDYYKETGHGLNFNTWVYESEIVTPTPNPTPVEVITPTDLPVEEIEPTPTEEPKEVITTPTETPQKENKFVAILKDAWLTILILIAVIIGAIVWRIKYKKSDD